MMTSRTSALFTFALLLFFSLSAWAEVVNLNKADAAALQQYLTGIGPVKAKAIVSYRSKNGSFKSLDDLKQVPGIGNELIKKNRKNLSLKSGVSKGDPKAASKKTAKKSNGSKSSSSKKTLSDKKSVAKKSTKTVAAKKSSSAKQSTKSKTDKAKEKLKKKSK